ncbi:MAG: hypothetical protein BWZ10_01554 [candidate division BRC1 bacterium ADurb.BinA364]|nr:MAG: hypothetical protein BWZ10_01554 [candidate division BRC1 bacterium ADurb.BinA364]
MDFDKNALAVRGMAERLQMIQRRVHLARFGQTAQYAAAPAFQDEQSFAAGRQIGERRLRPFAAPSAPPARVQQPDQIPPPRFRSGQQRQPAAAALLPMPSRVAHGQRQPQRRANARFAASAHEARRAAQRMRVGQRRRLHSAFGRRPRQGLRRGRAQAQAEIAVSVKMREMHRRLVVRAKTYIGGKPPPQPRQPAYYSPVAAKKQALAASRIRRIAPFAFARPFCIAMAGRPPLKSIL